MNNSLDPVSASSPLRVAIVGCGAVTGASLLPALGGHDQFRLVALVDPDVARARALAEWYGVPTVHADMAALHRNDIDAVVLATPPAHHAPATLRLAAQGLHVFVEKPMATATADAEAMVRAADEANVALAVGLYRRLLPVSRLLRGLLDQQILGRPVSVDIEEGGEYTWQLATLTGLTRAGGGGGVLIDIGSHLLDQLFFVLPGAPAVVGYADNARGGIETDCELRLAIDSRWGSVPVRMELSRTRQLRGSVRVVCERGTLELMRGDFCQLLVHPQHAEAPDEVMGQSRPFTVSAAWEGERDLVGYKAFRNEFDDWLGAIRSGRDAVLSGRSVLPVVRAIEEAYASPSRLDEPWTDAGLEPATLTPRLRLAADRRPRVVVTGAGGFLGCRTVELLHASGAWDVVPVVRRPGSAARLARLPLEIALGDVESPQDMARVLAGCDAVVHCAVGTGWPPPVAFKTTVDGTRIVADAALAAGVRRFVHISSMAVHGDRVPARLDETVPLDPGSGVGYGRAKFLAEQSVAEAIKRGLPAISLRPARIYGPFSRTFTIRPLSVLRHGRLVLAGDASTPANMVYVDNVVEAVVCALGAPDEAVGQAYLISEPDQLSWLAFFDYFAKTVGTSVATVPYPAAGTERKRGVIGRWKDGTVQILKSAELRGLAKKVMSTDPFGVLPSRLWESSPRLQKRVLGAVGVEQAIVYREPPAPGVSEVEFQIDPTLVLFEKATAGLGYRGAVPRDRAMALTLAWARYARLLG